MKLAAAAAMTMRATPRHVCLLSAFLVAILVMMGVAMLGSVLVYDGGAGTTTPVGDTHNYVRCRPVPSAGWRAYADARGCCRQVFCVFLSVIWVLIHPILIFHRNYLQSLQGDVMRLLS